MTHFWNARQTAKNGGAGASASVKKSAPRPLADLLQARAYPAKSRSGNGVKPGKNAGATAFAASGAARFSRIFTSLCKWQVRSDES